MTYEARVENPPPNMRGWSWKQVVFASASIIAIAIKDVAAAVREGHPAPVPRRHHDR